MREDRPDLAAYGDKQLAEWYPDGVAYRMWPVGVPEKMGNWSEYLTSVRRGSITPV